MVNSMKSNIDHVYHYAAPLVSYDPETGKFVWRWREGKCKGNFNNQYAGKECGCHDKNGYLIISVKVDGRLVTLKAHRLAWLITYGEIPKGDIDHIDGNEGNNTIANLRDVPASINMRNQRMMKNNKSGITGVSIDKRTGKWAANAKSNDKNHYLGRFSDINDAAKAVKEFREAHGYTGRHGKERE